MLKAKLIRTETGIEGTFGIMIVEGMTFLTAEPIWCNNLKNVSCIPAGDYFCDVVNSPKFGEVYQIKDVVNRSHILIHPGNWAGVEALGKKTDTDGCLMLGAKFGEIQNQKVVTGSRKSVDEFMEIFKGKRFYLTIIDMFK